VPIGRADRLVLSQPSAHSVRMRSSLDELYVGFDHLHSATDPVHIVRRFTDPADREVVGFCAAGLAFGRVASVLQSIEALLAVIGPHPAAFVRSFEPAQQKHRFEPLVHRWIRGRDLLALMLILRRMLREHGSIEGFFAAGDNPAAPDVRDALESFSSRALETDVRAAHGPHRPARAGIGYFFPRPSGGSACKRLNLFLRWMVRKDVVDMGVWTRVSPARLIVPLDTHVIRLGQCLRLTRYRSPGWKMAAEITASLRAIDPVDPVRYDFSLCHVGMMNACGFNRAQKDSQCPLRGVCRPTVRKRRRSPRPSARR
jgi:uncharacterized protein (TIGR02757 family)